MKARFDSVVFELDPTSTSLQNCPSCPLNAPHKALGQSEVCHISDKCDGHDDTCNTCGFVAKNPSSQVVKVPKPAASLYDESIPIREERRQLELNGQAWPRRSIPAKFANIPVGTISREDASAQPVLDLVGLEVLDRLFYLNDGGTAVQQWLEQRLCCVSDLGLAGVQC